MKNILRYLIVYISILVVWYIFIIMILDIFNVINFNVNNVGSLSFVAIPFGYIYHKYKPMEFKELLKIIREKF